MSDKSKKERAALLLEVHRILVSKTEIATADRIRLRDAVGEFVFAEQTKGTSLSRMTHVIREILERSEVGSSVSQSETAPGPTEDLAHELVVWCVQDQRGGGPIVPTGPALLS